MMMNLYLKNDKSNDLYKLFYLSRFIVNLAGIIISLFALKNVLHITWSLAKDKSYNGNEPYMIAALITLGISIFILAWASKGLIMIFKETDRPDIQEPPLFEDSNELERALVKRQITSTETVSGKLIAKDRTLVRAFLFFIGFVILGLILKFLLPDELFWNFKITPDYFSFPILFMGILAGAAMLRWGSLYISTQVKNSKMEVLEVTKLLKGKGNPHTFVPEIEKSLLPLQQNGKPNIIYSPDRVGIDNSALHSGGLKKNLFIETQPKSILYKFNPLAYLYLLYSVIMFIIGFFFLTESPPDNISVLSVPTIACDYLWTIIKGIVLVVVGGGLQKSIALGFTISQFESLLSYVYIAREGIEKSEDIEEAEEGGILVRSDYHFKVFTTKLLTEIDPATEKRRIIKMSIDEGAEKMKNLIINAIEKLIR